MKYFAIVISIFTIVQSSLAQQSFKWKTLNANTSENITDIYFHTPEIGYIVGDNYLFKKTTDGGKTWKDLTAPSSGEMPGNNGDIVAIEYHKSITVSNIDSGLFLTWKKGYHGAITSDDGANYSIFRYADSNMFCNINGFKALPENKGNGYVNLITFGETCSEKPVYYNYYDGWFSFSHADSVHSTSKSSFTSVDRDSLTTIFGSSNGYLYKYRWVTSKPDSVYVDSNGITALASAGNKTWYAASNSGLDNMFISLDSGNTFNRDTTFQRTFHYPEINDMSFVSPTFGIAAATSNGRNGVIIMKDTNSWFFLTAQEPLRSAKLFPNGIGYVAGDNGLIMKTGETDTVNSLAEPDFHALDIFPNPTRNTLHLEGVSDLKINSLRLLDVYGKEVLQFSNSARDLDLITVPEGIYYLIISTQHISIKRVVVKQY